MSKWNDTEMEPAELNGIKERAQQREEETPPPAEKKGWGGDGPYMLAQLPAELRHSFKSKISGQKDSKTYPCDSQI